MITPIEDLIKRLEDIRDVGINEVDIIVNDSCDGEKSYSDGKLKFSREDGRVLMYIFYA